MSWGHLKDIACKVSYCGNVTKSKVTVTFPFTGGNGHVASKIEPLSLITLTTCENIRRASRRAVRRSHQATASGHIKPLLHKCLRGGKDGCKTDLGCLNNKVWVYCIKPQSYKCSTHIHADIASYGQTLAPLNHNVEAKLLQHIQCKTSQTIYVTWFMYVNEEMHL